jgi:hypothetical protein
MTERQVLQAGTARSRRDKVVAIVTVPAWYAVLYLAFVGYMAVQTRSGVDGWGDLILFIAIAYGALGFLLGSSIGVVAMAVRMRSDNWRAGPVVSGTVAAVIGVAGCGLILLIVQVLNL